MNRVLKKCLFFSAVAVSVWTFQASAQSDLTNSFSSESYSLDDKFHGGQHEAAFDAGVLFCPFISVRGRATVDYAFGEAQLGFMVTDVEGPSVLRGNFELVPSVFGAGIFGGNTGTYISGGTLWFRYNFVPRQSRLVPYAQVGGGWTFMDIDHRLDGMNFNFNVDGGVGLRYFITQCVSLNAEYRFQHISNANLGEHNLGLNAEGPVLGISWLF